MSSPVQPAAFVINLARDTGRRAHMATVLDRIGLRAMFVPAVDGKMLTAAERTRHDPVRSLRLYGKPMLDTEIGCYLSHYGLWQRILDEGMDTSLILETISTLIRPCPG